MKNRSPRMGREPAPAVGFVVATCNKLKTKTNFFEVFC